jgi:tripartite-type tricarboxylate transporter receptor subunit TctC
MAEFLLFLSPIKGGGLTMKNYRLTYFIRMAFMLVVAFLLMEAQIPAQETFPSHPIQIIVGNPPGGAADLHARHIAEAMQKVLNQPVMVVTKVGASGSVAYQTVANNKPDGYTIGLVMPSFLIQPQVDILFGRKPSFNIEKFRPLARLSADPNIIVVHADSPWKSLPDLVADAKRRPGQITFGSAGLYSGAHFICEIFSAAAGITMRHIPYKGVGPSITALLGRHVDTMATGPGPGFAHLKAGTMRGLAVSSTKRLPLLPDIPTFKEFGYNVEYSMMVGLVVRKDTPPAVMKVLRDAVRKAAGSPEFKEGLAKVATEVAYLDEEEFREAWERDAKSFSEILKRIGRKG